MAAAHETILFDVHDFKVYPLTSDSGASPVYGAGIDVYGIAEVGLDPNFITAELKGDGGKVLAKKGRVDRLTGNATYGRLSGDVLEVILGALASDPSATQSRTRIKGGVSLPYFKAAFRIEDADNDIEDVLVTLYKSQITGGTLLGQSTDNFGQPTFEWEAISLASTGNDENGDPWLDVIADIDFYTVETALP